MKKQKLNNSIMQKVLLITILILNLSLFSQTNIALNKPTNTDSQFDSTFIGANAVDGNNNLNSSRWVSSNTSWPHWIEVDLQDNYEINRLKFFTGHSGTYNESVQYRFEYWDGNNWIVMVNGASNTSGIVDQNFNPISVSKVRLYGTGSSRDNLFRLYELEVYGSTSNSNGGDNTAIDPTNVFVGEDSGSSNTTGNYNTYLGAYSGKGSINGIQNVYIGANSGRNATGNNNVFIGYNSGRNEIGNYKLYIDNSDTNTPLIYGDFSTDQIGINTNSIPEGYTLAVNGGIFSNKTGHFGDDGVEKFMLRLGVNQGTGILGRRNFEWFKGDEGDLGVYHSIADNNNKRRHEAAFNQDVTSVAYFDNAGDEIYKLLWDGSSNVLQLGKANSKLRIGVFGDYLTDQAMVIRGNSTLEGDMVTTGSISVGTNIEDPNYKLTVKGKIHVQEVKVDLLGAIAPDYVFYKDYDLRTLEEVQSYIDQEGHLPNIPSANEMQKEGVNLKEMNLKLLEKVEELTLYTIAQEKAIKEQESKNKELEERLQKLEKLLKQ